MWKQVSPVTWIRAAEGKSIVRLDLEAYISLADAKGIALHLDDGSRLGVVSRFKGKPYDVDDDPVDGETEPIMWALPPEFYLWEE